MPRAILQHLAWGCLGLAPFRVTAVRDDLPEWSDPADAHLSTLPSAHPQPGWALLLDRREPNQELHLPGPHVSARQGSAAELNSDRVAAGVGSISVGPFKGSSSMQRLSRIDRVSPAEGAQASQSKSKTSKQQETEEEKVRNTETSSGSAGHAALAQTVQRVGSSRRKQQNQTSDGPGSGSEPHPGRRHDEAKYAYKKTTDDMEGLRDAVEAVDATKDSAAKKASAVQPLACLHVCYVRSCRLGIHVMGSGIPGMRSTRLLESSKRR